MLDDLKFIHGRDKNDALGLVEKSWRQYLHDFGFNWQPPRPIYEVIVAAMGGSGLSAEYYRAIDNLQVPFEVIRDYDVPDRADENTLLILISYSGNTEESVSVLEQALDVDRPYSRPMIVVIASGGKLLDIAKKEKLPHIELPTGYDGRFAFGYQIRALAEVFNTTPLTDNFLPSLESTASSISLLANNWLPTIPTKNNLAKRLALDIIGKSTVIYAGPKLAVTAHKWKLAINENAKSVAWWGQYPESSHNEFAGWSAQPPIKPYAVIDLRSDLENPRVQKRFELSEKLLSGLRPAPIIVQAEGETLLEQIFYCTLLADFVSIYMALVTNIDPSDLKIVDKLKQEMGK